MAVFEYLNDNQGAVMALLTAVYVVAAVVTTWIVRRSNRLVRESNDLARQALEQNLRLERERSRPYVIFDFIIKSTCLHAVLQNIGKTPAVNVRVALDKPVKRLGPEEAIPFTRHPIAFMAPGRTVMDFINVAHQFFKDHESPIFTVSIEYEDTSGTSFSEKVVVELEHQKGLSHIVPKNHMQEAAKELKTIAKHLQELRRSMDQLVWEQNTMVERTRSAALGDNASFDAGAFLREVFADRPPYERRVYLNILTHSNTVESETTRSKVLRCEQMGLLRRERDYFVLTEAGHAALERTDAEEASAGEEPRADQEKGEAGVSPPEDEADHPAAEAHEGGEELAEEQAEG